MFPLYQNSTVNSLQEPIFYYFAIFKEKSLSIKYPPSYKLSDAFKKLFKSCASAQLLKRTYK